jgi:hemoglobin
MLSFAILLLQAAPALSPDEEAVAPYVQNDSNAGARPVRGDALWKSFHGSDGVSRIVDDLVARNQNDPRVSDIFRNQDTVRLRRTLKEQFCYILNGGCHYTGRDMKTAHQNMGLQQADMGALVENLRASMRQEGVAFAAQNQLLAKLASMQRDVVQR